MVYRTLGRTGLRVSRLGFGTMRLPMTSDQKTVDRSLAIPMLHRAFEAGVNYVDTATMYCAGDSQKVIGEALRGWRDTIIVSTKNPYYGNDEREWWKNLEMSLRLLDVDYIDIYNHHGINYKEYIENVKPRISKWMRKAYDQKLIRHICASFHDTCDGLKKIVDTGYVESITLQYNLLDRQLEEGIAYAHEKNVGIVVMGPVGGGRLGVRSSVLEKLIPGVHRVPELALRFVLDNPHVTVALSGMETIEMVEENAAIASDAVSLSPQDRDAIEEHILRLKKMSQLYCTGCGYCLPCPQEVAIPKIFERFNLGRVYGLWDAAKKQYASIGSHDWDRGKRADACVGCGQCEEKCPQKIPIRWQLKDAHEMLS